MKITAKHLFELAGIPIPYILLIEGYKEATAEFSAVSPDAPAKIEAFRALVNKNQAIGDERNIDYWRKQGWEAFVAFVDSKSGPTKTALKRKKVVGQSITLREDDEWLIVVPLDKDASCFHGKNSDWCTTKYNQSHFEKYFYDNEAVLVYCLNKTSGGMWALAGHKRAKGKLELFDQRDKKLTSLKFEQQTGLNAVELINLALAQSDPINKSRSDYVEVRAESNARLETLPNGTRDEELERTIVKYKLGSLAWGYFRGGREASEDVQKLAVQQPGYAIQYIKNPSEEVQKLAVQYAGYSLYYIENPTEEAQKLAVQQNGTTIRLVKNPSEEVQKLAVSNTGLAIQFIENPSEEVQKLAVQQRGDAIEFIKNPSEELQVFAVRRDGTAVQYIKNPSEEVQKLAVKKTWEAIRFIKNPSEGVQMLAVKKTAASIRYIEDPTPAVVAFHNERWNEQWELI